MLNVFKKTNVSLGNTHATNLLLVPMLISLLNVLVLKDTTAMVSVLLMAVADVSILTNAPMVLQNAQITQPATITTEAMIVIVMLVTRNLQMVITFAKMSMNVPVMSLPHLKIN